MMENIKAFLLNTILESIEKHQQIVLPWWWVFLPTSWKKEFSELLIVAIPLIKTSPEQSYARSVQYSTGILGTIVATMLALFLFTNTGVHMTPLTMVYKAAANGQQQLESTFGSPFDASEFGSQKVVVASTLYQINAPPKEFQALLEELNAIIVPDYLNHEAWVVDQKRLLGSLQYRILSPDWYFSATSTSIDDVFNSFLTNTGFEDPVLVVEAKVP